MKSGAGFRLAASIAVVPLAALLAGIPAFLLYRNLNPEPTLNFSASGSGASSNWNAYGGNWEISNGEVRNDSDEWGAKLMTGSYRWKDYSMTATIKPTRPMGDMGVVVRANSEEEGIDAYSGYYVGLRFLDGALTIGRADFGWMEARPVAMPGGVQPDVWYRLKVVAFGCSIAASAENLATHQMAWIAFEEQPCVNSGRVGLRSLFTGGSWRNIRVAPAGEAEYREIRDRATALEAPEFPRREADFNNTIQFHTAEDATLISRFARPPSTGQVSRIGNLQEIPRDEEKHAVVVGRVILTWPQLYLQDSSGGILVRAGQDPRLDVGDVVQADGLARAGLYKPSMKADHIAVVGSGALMPALAITSTQAASGAYDARFVEVEGVLLGSADSNGLQTLEIFDGAQTFSAILASRLKDRPLRLEMRSHLRLRGVCVLDRSFTKGQTPFALLLRSGDDVLVLSGPPWWTPWHLVLLIVFALAVVLMVQVAYFRLQQWKARVLTEERDRLAHDIHDTMAQSFAGVGYQIEGISTSIKRRLDDSIVQDQLRVAYQLVSRCHREASETISMLGAPAPGIQHDLLNRLRETACHLTGDGIQVTASSAGAPFPLNLRLACALQQIGKEAIANAVNHAKMSALSITLDYQDRSVELRIEDNGVGFHFMPRSVGFGILGMQKRARDVGGILSISSEPGQGTRVSVLVRSIPADLRSRLRAWIRTGLPIFRIR